MSSGGNASLQYCADNSTQVREITLDHACFGPFQYLPDLAGKIPKLDIDKFDNPRVVRSWLQREYARIGFNSAVVDSDSKIDFYVDRDPYLITRLSDEEKIRSVQLKALSALVKDTNSMIQANNLPGSVRFHFHLSVSSTQNLYVQVNGRRYRALAGGLRPYSAGSLLSAFGELKGLTSPDSLLKNEVLDIHDSVLPSSKQGGEKQCRIVMVAPEELCDQIILMSQDIYDGGDQQSVMQMECIMGFPEMYGLLYTPPFSYAMIAPILNSPTFKASALKPFRDRKVGGEALSTRLFWLRSFKGKLRVSPDCMGAILSFINDESAMKTITAYEDGRIKFEVAPRSSLQRTYRPTMMLLSRVPTAHGIKIETIHDAFFSMLLRCGLSPNCYKPVTEVQHPKEECMLLEEARPPRPPSASSFSKVVSTHQALALAIQKSRLERGQSPSASPLASPRARSDTSDHALDFPFSRTLVSPLHTAATSPPATSPPPPPPQEGDDDVVMEVDTNENELLDPLSTRSFSLGEMRDAYSELYKKATEFERTLAINKKSRLNLKSEVNLARDNALRATEEKNEWISEHENLRVAKIKEIEELKTQAYAEKTKVVEDTEKAMALKSQQVGEYVMRYDGKMNEHKNRMKEDMRKNEESKNIMSQTLHTLEEEKGAWEGEKARWLEEKAKWEEEKQQLQKALTEARKRKAGDNIGPDGEPMA